MGRPSWSITRACRSVLSPPKVNTFAEITGQALNGAASIGRAQFDLGGIRPVVASPSACNGSNAPSPQAELYAATVRVSGSAGTSIADASSPIVIALTGGWSVRLPFCQLGTS